MFQTSFATLLQSLCRKEKSILSVVHFTVAPVVSRLTSQCHGLSNWLLCNLVGLWHYLQILPWDIFPTIWNCTSTLYAPSWNQM